MNSETRFNAIVEKMVNNEQGVILGKMMSSPGLKVNNKVFAFFHKGEMGFRLGKKFDPAKFGLKHFHLLNPFKTKPPLAGWYVVSGTEMEYWEDLSDLALDFTRTLR